MSLTDDYCLLPEPELAFRRWSNIGERPTRYKLLYRVEQDQPFILLAWVIGRPHHWQVTGSLWNIDATFASHREAAEACLKILFEAQTQTFTESLKQNWFTLDPRSDRRLTLKQAQVVFEILAKFGANDWEAFRRDAIDRDIPAHEHRFQGHFGYGGKFRNQHSSFSVDFYRKDRTPYRNWLEAQLNCQLRELYLGMFGPEK